METDCCKRAIETRIIVVGDEEDDDDGSKGGSARNVGITDIKARVNAVGRQRSRTLVGRKRP